MVSSLNLQREVFFHLVYLKWLQFLEELHFYLSFSLLGDRPASLTKISVKRFLNQVLKHEKAQAFLKSSSQVNSPPNVLLCNFRKIKFSLLYKVQHEKYAVVICAERLHWSSREGRKKFVFKLCRKSYFSVSLNTEHERKHRERVIKN